MRAVAVDIDGILANFVYGFSEMCRNLEPRLPIIKNHSECPEWRMQPWYGKAEGVDPKQVAATIEQAWSIIHQSYTFWRDLPVLVESKQLRTVAREQPLIFMTRRDGYLAYKQTASWLTYHYGVQEPLLVRVSSGEEKSEWCNRLGIKVLIDDSPDYGGDFLQNVEGGTLFQPAYHYNDVTYGGAGRLVYYDWREFDLALEAACETARKS